MQNSYNNFLKRQKQTPTSNFKEKIANSLSGKALNNTTMPNTANKINTLARSTTQIPTTPSKTVQPVNNINTQQVITTPPTTQNTAQNTIPKGTQTLTTPQQASQQVVGGASQQTVEAPVEGATGQGMMSLTDINSAMSVGENAQTTNNPYARSTSSPTDDYKELLQQNKDAMIEQANKGWETQQEAYKTQMESLKAEYEQSKVDAENAYKDTVDGLVDNRYNQMEDLAVSGTNRGLQYSPQQLGLENVVNINHNKNLLDASKKRNELLNSLQIQMNKALAELNVSMINAQNQHNKDLLGITTDFNDKLINWGRDDYLTQQNRDWEKQQEEERRKWEEEQKKQQQEYEKLMQELQNKFDKEMQDSQNNWQSNENQLNRDHETALSKSRSTGGGYSGYSGGYGGYSRSYTPYSSGDYSNYDNTTSLSDDIEARAYQSTFNNVSDDAYSAYTSLKSPYNADMRAQGYASEVDEMINYAKKSGASEEAIKNLQNTKDKAMKQMFEDHSGYKNYNGDAIARGNDKVKFYKNNVTNSLDKKMANQAESVVKAMNKKSTTTNKSTKSKTTKTNTTKATTTKKTTTKTNATKSKVAKSVSNSSKNAKKSTNTKKTSQKTQKAVSKSNNNSKKAGNNALKNLKKNISKLFGK